RKRPFFAACCASVCLSRTCSTRRGCRTQFLRPWCGSIGRPSFGSSKGRAMAVVIKKYGNRRLYDAEASHYVTLGEIAAKVRQGAEVRVVDAKSGADLTQATLTQI